MNPQTATSAGEKAMTGVGEHYYELHAGRRGNAAADEAMLRAVPFLRKLGERHLRARSCPLSRCQRKGGGACARLAKTGP